MELEWAVHIRSCHGAPRGGDAGVVVPDEDGALAALIDATGHGLTAYAVAQTARHVLLQTSSREPAAVLQELDAALAGSIGAAISVAHIRLNELAFAGIGNVSASVGLHPLLVRPGVVGRRMRTPTVVRASFEPNTWLLMHTDGVSRPEVIPPGDADTAARVLVEAKGSRHDDAGVLLMRWRGRRP
jgi:hypothetical protein